MQIKAAVMKGFAWSLTSAAELVFFFFFTSSLRCYSREALLSNFHFASNNMAHFQPATHTEFDKESESYRAVAHFSLPRFFFPFLAPVDFFFFLSDLCTFLDYHTSPPALTRSFGRTPSYSCFFFFLYSHTMNCV